MQYETLKWSMQSASLNYSNTTFIASLGNPLLKILDTHLYCIHMYERVNAHTDALKQSDCISTNLTL